MLKCILGVYHGAGEYKDQKLNKKPNANDYKWIEFCPVEANYGRRRKCLGKKEVYKRS